MGSFVIAAYKPKHGMEQQLLAVVARHWHILRAENLISEKPARVMRAADGTIIEVFEWLSDDAIEQAHKNTAVVAHWAEFDKVCEYVPIGSVEESKQVFSGFEAVELEANPGPS